LSFPRQGESAYPFAVKIGIEGRNIVSGRSWHHELGDGGQDYLVIPGQSWLDGFPLGSLHVDQFIAEMTETAHDGPRPGSAAIEIILYPMRADFYEHRMAILHDERSRCCGQPDRTKPRHGLAIAPGGRIREPLHADTYGVAAWDQSYAEHCHLVLVPESEWGRITGRSSTVFYSPDHDRGPSRFTSTHEFDESITACNPRAQPANAWAGSPVDQDELYYRLSPGKRKARK
jgi:hypothetical protein